MNFNFNEKPTVDICGKPYECDITDNALIAGVSSDFPQIIRLAGEFEELQNKCVAATTNLSNDEGIPTQIVEKNRELTEACKVFICGCLGEQEYNEIFQNRRPNSTEHVKLCAYLFEFIMSGRSAMVAEYADPPEGCYVVDSITAQNS